MRTLFLITFFCCIVRSISCEPFLSFEEKIPILIKKYKIPGVAIAVVKGGDTSKIICYGFRDKKNNLSISEKSIFQIGSISKTLTAWGILKLVESGKIELDSPVEKYLLSWHLPSSKYQNNDVTIKGLLNHTAGLSVSGYFGYADETALPTLIESLNGIKSSHTKLKLISPPGKSFRYSGGGYTLLQLLIEDITQNSFQEFMEKEIFNKLGARASSFYPRQDVEICKCYGLWGEERQRVEFTEKAAAGLYTSITDMASFLNETLQCYHNKSQRVLSRQNIEMMMDVEETSYALGYDVELLSSDTFLAFHEGANPGWRAGIFLLPNQNLGLAILTNSDGGSEFVEEVASSWIASETTFLPKFYQSLQKRRTLITWSSAILFILSTIFPIQVILRKNKLFKAPKRFSLFRVSFWLLIGISWAVIFYTPLFLPTQWTIRAFMPHCFDVLTWAFSLFSFSGLLRELSKT